MKRLWSERPIPEKYLTMFEHEVEFVGAGRDSPETLMASFPGAHAVIASSRIQYDGTLMDQNEALRVISRTGIGVDNISIADATVRGVVVCNTPDGPTISTAEMAFTLILAVARDLKRVSTSFEKGRRDDFFTTYQGMELYGRFLGVVGLGRIGSRVAKMGLAMGMIVRAYDPYVSEAYATSIGVSLIPSLRELLRETDILTLHVPLTEENHNLINADRLAQMKPGAVLINTARGGLVNEEALLDALDSSRLRGAGLDVLRQKPIDLPSTHPLLKREDVILTPHIASATGAGKDRLWRTALDQAFQVLRNERPEHIVNPEVWETRR
jgi:D-3-phosphoglycerate dehydrogenase